MRRGAVATLLAAGLLAAETAAQEAGPPGTYAFTHVDVLSMASPDLHPDRTVVVRDGIIVAVGPAAGVEVPQGARVIDGRGRILMPGLAEMHAHVPPRPDPDMDQVREILFLYIANGITTIRGMLGQTYQIQLARDLEAGRILGPTFYVGAPSINGNSAPDPETAERLVRRHKAQGYDLQKIHPGVSLATWDRMAAVARELDFPFGGHVPADVGLVHALESGMSSVDHLDGYVQAIAGDDVVAQINTGRPISLGGLARGADDEKLQEVIHLTLRHNAYVVPTLYLWENLYGTTDPEPFLNLPEMRYVSEAQKEAWRRQASRGPRGTPEELEAFFTLRKRILKELSDAGAGILMGTDSPQMFNVPGFALHREIRLMEEAGMSRYAILRSGTVNVARYVAEHLHRRGNFGTVEEGNRADLVLLDANPLEDLDNLTARVGVMVRGRWIPREGIDRRLARIAAKYGG
ncbi:MAG: amidohydrolase family protein [Gemmatimonadota bacterium]